MVSGNRRSARPLQMRVGCPLRCGWVGCTGGGDWARSMSDAHPSAGEAPLRVPNRRKCTGEDPSGAGESPSRAPNQRKCMGQSLTGAGESPSRAPKRRKCMDFPSPVARFPVQINALSRFWHTKPPDTCTSPTSRMHSSGYHSLKPKMHAQTWQERMGGRAKCARESMGACARTRNVHPQGTPENLTASKA